MTGFPPLTICFVDSIFTFWFWILRERHISFFPGRRQVPCREQGHPLASLLYVFNTYCGICHKIVLNKYVPLCIYISQVTVWVQNSKVRKQSCTCHLPQKARKLKYLPDMSVHPDDSDAPTPSVTPSLSPALYQGWQERCLERHCIPRPLSYGEWEGR